MYLQWIIWNPNKATDIGEWSIYVGGRLESFYYIYIDIYIYTYIHITVTLY